MANYLGDFALSQVFNTKFCTTAASTGAPTTLSGSPAISIYKSNSTTQSTSGITLTADFDSVTGLNNVNVDLSSDGTFYATGNDFQIIITTGTVGGTSAVGYVVGEFSINNRTPLRPTTAGNTASIDNNGRVDVIKIAGTTQTARDIGASVLLSAGTGTGQLDFTSGVVKANLAQILGTALTETAGLLAGGFKKFFNVATPTGTLNSIPDAVAGATGGLFIAGTNAATTVTTALTTTFTGNLTGSVGSVTGAVGSVTGAVGSVTGNVGGNVTGSVGSVVGNVGGNVNGNVVGSVASVTADVGITQAGADKVFGSSGAAMAELSGVPSATPSPRNALMLIFMTLRNKLTTTASSKAIFNDAGSSITSKALADDGTTYTESKMA